MELNETLCPSSSVRSVSDDDGAVLLDIEQNLIYTTDPVGSLIWNYIREGYPKQTILEKLVVMFSDMERVVLEADLNEFLASLVKAKVAR